ncbi:O-antigen ligase family protein [Aerococcus sanguinicola]|uniref:O-antigen ligase family protein n=1 Tax=Aerococcus sanguinicola TaxID=119206 RepID=UPI001E4249B5|nr:O-antigen ligase family protein [Aerococcus sanguinicola]
MAIYSLILLASVFLGTELLAIPTPFAQMTIYRLLALGVLPLIAYQSLLKGPSLKLKRPGYGLFMIGAYVFWWLWALISVLWARALGPWAQAVFLLTIGISSVVALYLWTDSLRQWKRLVQAAWWMMSALLVWGYFEIITNIYLFADMAKLDKYGTFASQPLTRLPITHFENQNDYATMLLAYLVVTAILLLRSRVTWQKTAYLLAMVLAEYLIFRSGSRMSLLCSFLYFGLVVLLQFKWDLKRRHYVLGLLALILGSLALYLWVPPVQEALTSLIYTGSEGYISGDTGRVNLWRNGLVFLGTTLGLGVGAGNIETWMADFPLLPTKGIVNMHNWWLEIMVGYGLFVFLAYVVAYALMLYRLNQIRLVQSPQWRQVTNQVMAFLLVFIPASVTSANNMYIEWHWAFFGLLISYLALAEKSLTNTEKERGRMYELSNND